MCEAAAWAALANSSQTGSMLAIANATAALKQNNTNATVAWWRTEVIKLSAALNASVGAKQISNQDSTLNVATMDTPLSEAPFLLERLREIAQISGPGAKADRLSAIEALVNHTDPRAWGILRQIGSRARTGPASLTW